MIDSILIVIAVSLLSSAPFCWAFTWFSRQRLYSLECDVADLQDRQLTSVRKAAALKRWEGEDEFDSRLSEMLKSPTLEAKRGPKWVSSRNSNLAKSSEALSKDLRPADSKAL